MTFVLDASVTLTWFYVDERTEATNGLLARATSEGAWAPGLWAIEVANAFQQGVRRGRLSSVQRDAVLRSLASVPVAIDPETSLHAWTATLRLSTRHRLTVYDACYLELARRRGLPLATLDVALRAAAEEEGVALLGL